MSAAGLVTNPATGRLIRVGGATYNRVFRSAPVATARRVGGFGPRSGGSARKFVMWALLPNDNWYPRTQEFEAETPRKALLKKLEKHSNGGTVTRHGIFAIVGRAHRGPAGNVTVTVFWAKTITKNGRSRDVLRVLQTRSTHWPVDRGLEHLDIRKTLPSPKNYTALITKKSAKLRY